MTAGLRRDLLDTPAGRRVLFAALYVSEGAPIGFVWWAMPSLLAGEGVELSSITTLTALATLPWVLKFLIAPVIDGSLRSGASLRRWVLVCQLGMASALLPLIWLDWGAQLQWVTLVVMLYAVLAATQDVAIDTLAIHVVPRQELGRVNGWMQTGMLVGRAVVAAGSALVAAQFGSPGAAVPFMVAMIALPAVLLIVATRDPTVERAPVSVGSVLEVLRRPAVLAGAAVALLVGAGFEFFGVSVGPRLVADGASAATIAWFYGLAVPTSLASGALAGGAAADRLGALAATAVGLIAVTVALIAVAFGDSAEGVSTPFYLAVAAYVATGFLTASSYALFMTLARGALAATKFSLFMAMTNACEAWAGFVGGRLADNGYAFALLALTAIACTAVVPLRILRASSWQRRVV